MRMLLLLLGSIGGFVVAMGCWKAPDSLAVMKWMGVGVGLLIILVAWGLADLSHEAQMLRTATRSVDETTGQVRDVVGVLGIALRDQFQAADKAPTSKKNEAPSPDPGHIQALPPPPSPPQ